MLDASLADIVLANQRGLLLVCDALEAVADSLPNDVDRGNCLALANAIAPLLAEAQRLEEAEIFPALLALKHLRPELTKTLGRLGAEHQTDLCYAEEVQDMLRGYAEDRRDISPDAAGFMLRGFFESLRRHIAFERELLLPLLKLLDARAARAG